MLYPEENGARGVMRLDGVWRFKLDRDGKGFDSGWLSGLPADAEALAVPASFNEQREDADYRTHCGWAFYERDFTVPSFFAGQRLVLRFDAVTHWAKVYLNGQLLTEHRGGFLPFEAEVTGLVKPGETARVTVAVNNEINHGILPIGNEGATAFFGSDNPGIPSVEAAKLHRKKQNIPNFDFFNYAGINRPVRLYTTPAAYIDDVTVTTAFDCAAVAYGNEAGQPSTARQAQVRISVETGVSAALMEVCGKVENASVAKVCAKTGSAAVLAGADQQPPPVGRKAVFTSKPVPQVRILDADGRCVAEGALEQEAGCAGKKQQTHFSAAFTIQNAKLWEPHPGVPYLYTAEISYGEDVYTQPFGIRSVEVCGTKFLINGRPFYFKGCCKHEDAPIRGRGFDLLYDVKDISMLKWLHANSFRTSHYPYAEEMYQLCDREGIVVIDETPAVGIGAGAETDPYKSFRMHAHHEQVVREYIARDKNHPCVVMWSLGNEPDLEHFPESAYNYWHHLYELAHSLDPQNRPVTVVCCQNDYTKDITTRTMDVVCINRYYGWYNVSGDMDAACYGWNVELDFWEKIGKPVMCSEYGADTVEGLHQTVPEMFSEEYQRAFYRRTNAEFDKRDFFIGEHVWCFADFKTIQGPMRVNGNRKGILTRDRQPKTAAHWLRERWAEIPNFGYKA